MEQNPANIGGIDAFALTMLVTFGVYTLVVFVLGLLAGASLWYRRDRGMAPPSLPAMVKEVAGKPKKIEKKTRRKPKDPAKRLNQ